MKSWKISLRASRVTLGLVEGNDVVVNAEIVKCPRNGKQSNLNCFLSSKKIAPEIQ